MKPPGGLISVSWLGLKYSDTDLHACHTEDFTGSIPAQSCELILWGKSRLRHNASPAGAGTCSFKMLPYMPVFSLLFPWNLTTALIAQYVMAWLVYICLLQHRWLPFHTMTSQRLVAFVVESIHYWILSRLSFEEVGGKPIQGAKVILLQTLPDWPSHLLFSRDFLLSSFQRCVTIFCTYPRKHPLLTLSRSGPSCISLKTMTKTFPPFKLIVPKILDLITLTQKAGFRNENCSCRNCDLWAFGRTLLFSCHQCTSTSAKSCKEWSSNQTQSEPLNRTVQCLNWIKLAAVRLRNKSWDAFGLLKKD